MRLKCIRTNSTTGKETTEVHKAELRYSTSMAEWWIHIVPGVTGYESASLKNLLDPDRYSKSTGWSACAGTPGSWDSLLVPAEEMERLKDMLRLLPIT